ncbi:terminase small subunit [Streptomyces phage Gilgamesh]|uniref:Terminase small subunit n=1 Tax=Streptomyces phage Gilgamesh TaxID=2599890 RepID=A0A5J6TTM8_9CAUD|nr:terminase small subunit [Streptomyces phage Gilgamesh]QFG13277.1 terminase small subunit [Streptomyces phage Gilgamesh]
MSTRRKARRPQSRAGRPRLLSEEVEQRLVAASRTGVAVELAAEMAGVSRSSFLAWMARGRAEVEAREAGEKPNPDEEEYAALYEKVRTARATAAARAMMNIRRVADGGVVTKVTTRKFRDSVTGDIVEETVEDRTPPDWRADAWYLERQHRDQYGKDAILAVEITGFGDIPTGDEDQAVDLSALAERLDRSLFSVEYPPELETGDVVDAEVVD